MQADELKHAILNAWEDLPQRAGFRISYINADKRWSIEQNGEEQFAIASTFKTFLLAECLRQVERGEYALEDRLEITERVRTPDSEIIDELPDGSTLSIRELLEAMISVSDNTATEIILRKIGHERGLALLQEIGLDHSYIPASLRDSYAQTLGWDPDTVTYETLMQCVEEKIDPPSYNPDIVAKALLSSPCDLTTYYEYVFAGNLFKQPETIETFKAILNLVNARQKIEWPEGADAFFKGGDMDLPPYIALAAAGTAMNAQRQFHFAFCFNGKGLDRDSFAPTLETFRTGLQIAIRYFQSQLES